jgi:hypothetical protein
VIWDDVRRIKRVQFFAKKEDRRTFFKIERIKNLFSFKTPTKWAVMSEQGDADCAFEMRNGVKTFFGCDRMGYFWLVFEKDLKR